MFGKVMIRNSFANVVRYAVDKEKNARIIASDGILVKDVDSIVRSFETQAAMHPKLTQKVDHIALSFSPNDKDRCTDYFMASMARAYMRRMGISDTQYIVVRHFDHEHPHIHIVYNRVNNRGKTISNFNQKINNRRVCKELTKKYGLYMSTGKEHVNRDRLRQPDKSRYAIYDAISAALPNCCSWRQFCEALSEKDISVELVTKGNTDEVQGVIFIFDGYRFTGSKVDRQYSYSKLKKRLRMNMSKHMRQTARQRYVENPHYLATKSGKSPILNLHGMTTHQVTGTSRNGENEVGSDDDYDNEESLRRKSWHR